MTDLATLQVEDLHLDYRRRPALRGATLTARPGRVYGLIGPNGAGKSSLMSCILGLVRPKNGRILIHGESWRPEHLGRIGASVNGPAFYPHLSATKNLRVHALLLGVDPEVIPGLLHSVGLADAGTTRARGFSTGMKCRLALAMALLGNPDILMLDEPQNGLDPEGIRALRKTVRRFAESGRTVIISSHQLGEVAHMADDIGVLAGGRTRWQGPLTEFAPGGDLEEAFFQLVSRPDAAS